jgi:hypothetical protein
MASAAVVLGDVELKALSRHCTSALRVLRIAGTDCAPDPAAASASSSASSSAGASADTLAGRLIRVSRALPQLTTLIVAPYEFLQASEDEGPALPDSVKLTFPPAYACAPSTAYRLPLRGVD